VLAATSPTATVQILDLKGNLIATADVTPGSASDTFNYSTTANISKDAIVKGVRENQTLRAALDSSTFTSGASRKVDVITTTAVVVIEQEMGITVGSLGTTSAPASPLSLKTVTIATLEANISQAVSSASSSTTTNFTSTDAAYANLAAIVTAATVSNINAAQYIANPSSATISIPITTYSVSKTGTPISTTAIMTPSVMQSTLNDALNTIVQPKPTGSTGGTGVAN
jgi:hypothetical protein